MIDWMKCLGVAVALLLAQATPAAPVAQDEVARFDAAIAGGDLVEASKIYGAAYDRRIEAAARGADPQMDRMFGTLWFRMSSGPVAAPWIDQAIAQAADPAAKARLLVLRAGLDIQTANPEAAERRYRDAIATAPAGTREHREVTYALARLLLASDPAAAIVLLQAALADTRDDAERWQGDLLLSRAFALTGDAARATATLALAWREAPAVAAGRDAVARTAQDLALAGDRPRMIALLAANATRKTFLNRNMVPGCSAAIKPEDWIVVELGPDDGTGDRLSVVRASRPGIAAAFADRLRRSVSMNDRDAQGGRLFELRCQMGPVSPMLKPPAIDPLFGWLAGRGAYGPLWFSPDDTQSRAARLETLLPRLRARYGDAAPELWLPIATLAFTDQLLMMHTRNPEYAQHIAALRQELDAIAAKGHAPGNLAELGRIADDPILPSASADDIVATLRRRIAVAVATPAMTPAMIAFLADGFSRAPMDFDRQPLYDDLLAGLTRRGVKPDDPAFRHIMFLKLDAMRAPTATKVDPALARQLGVPADACMLAEAGPVLDSSTFITEDDYPRDLIRESVIGVQLLETRIDASGKAVQSRIIAASPPRLFDDILKDRLGQAHIAPARNKGKAAACSIFTQTVRWQLPDDQNLPAPLGF